ncbi:thiol reductase thioredoxin [Jeotgalibaca sp. PTS2502]|uniref:thioredoxin family protein n=1 Tax=Jeotgalibaca sp. PTS2502 TaxID=1903686 RepID=UPI000973D6FC|nr:thioredoxin family protein [Jeotgalibaca sp. PTS2502]APZ49492.1 thiol reductase thioredoxin [Jeotgalibaca sp. PTS2502]
MTILAEASQLEDVTRFIKENRFALVYVKRQDCGVCHAVLPQLQRLLQTFPEIKLLTVDADRLPAVAGQYSVFTVPAILGFIDGKEQLRKARFVVMADLEATFEQWLAYY